MRLVSKVAEVFGCVNGMFGMLVKECGGEGGKKKNDMFGFWQRPTPEKYRFAQIKNSLQVVEVTGIRHLLIRQLIAI